MLRLAVKFEDKVRQYAVPKSAARLGSSVDSDLHAPFPGVSKRHLEVTPHADGVLLRDLGSKNGLVSEGRRVEECLLRPGQSVFVGRAALVLEDLSSSDGEHALSLPSSTSDAKRDSDSRATDRGPWTIDDSRLSPAPALRFIREHENKPSATSDRAGQLRQATAALGSETLMIVAQDAELTIESCHGPYPSDAFLEGLAFELAQGRPGPRVFGDALLGRRAPGDPRALIACFDPKLLPLEPWQTEFFEYLADRLLEGTDVPRAAVPTPTAAGSETLQFPPGMIVGSSPALQGLLTHMRATIKSEMNVLLVGETGTGKELFARLVHASGPKSRGPFVAINCAAIPAELLEAELFGVAARVATGVDPRPGLFVQAQGGTVFLDEIGDMPERLQAKMLRVLQEREVLPLGGSAAKKVDARVVAASNRDLAKLVTEGAFRADLFYRLRGLQFHIPPLRERREDLPELVLGFAARSAEKYKRHVTGISRRALALLMEHPWPGNVRELESEVERAVLLCADGGVLQGEHFGGILWLREQLLLRSAAAGVPSVPGIKDSSHARVSVPSDLAQQLDALERQAILRALQETLGNQTRAAKALGVTRNGLALKMRRLGISARPHGPN